MNKFSLDRMESLKEVELPDIRARLKTAAVITRSNRILKRSNDIGIIAEIKKASPSRGAIKSVSPEDQAMSYINGGAVALSVLTEKNFFGGSWDDLRVVSGISPVPVLCKEFMFFEEQIDLARACGADMILLIARVLSYKRLKSLYDYAKLLDLMPLVEVHSVEELPHVLALNPEFIMVNMRNLATIKIDEAAAIKTLTSIPSGIEKISASGIEDKKKLGDIFRSTGTRIYLIGTGLMLSEDPAAMIKELQNVH